MGADKVEEPFELVIDKQYDGDKKYEDSKKYHENDLKLEDFDEKQDEEAKKSNLPDQIHELDLGDIKIP